jgi:hypothetical protein
MIYSQKNVLIFWVLFQCRSAAHRSAWGRSFVFVIELAFHEVPHVFKGIQIQTVSRPINDLEWLISKEIPDPL